MEFSFDEAGDCNFKIKEFNQRFFPVNFDISFYEILPVFWKQLLLFLLHFDSCPAEAIMIWIIKQMNTLFISVVPRCFGEIVWPKKVVSFPGKCQRRSPVLIKLQDNVSKTGAWDRLFPRIFPILEQRFCIKYVCEYFLLIFRCFPSL